MKLQDKLSLGMSFAALLLSVGSLVMAEVNNIKASRSQVYYAYQLGKSVSVMYAYVQAQAMAVKDTAQSNQQISDQEFQSWQMSAMGYAQFFKIPTDYFNTFAAELKQATPSTAAKTFGQLNPYVQVAANHKAAAAYELGWLTTVVAIQIAGAASNPQIADVDKAVLPLYPHTRDTLNADLKEVGIGYSLPASVANTSEFVKALQKLKATVDAYRPS